jgi:hypothetical protein
MIEYIFSNLDMNPNVTYTSFFFTLVISIISNKYRIMG